ncbi:ABC transporter ATP-binding protein [Lentzea sp. NPDC004782]|uniref:ABC transporter ATP-binding protein n=1 Tax=Lentzea sp. NPDC004782 TaxID=3154458 RepID=UPI0033BA1E81
MLAIVPQRNNLDRSLYTRQNLLFYAAYHGISRARRERLADEVLERMGLMDQAKAQIDTLSGGQAQRLMIGRALMHRPEVLFLDEPGNGLDPQARLFVHERVASLREEDVTVVLTTHDMEEAAKLCHRVGVIDPGKLLTLGTPAELSGNFAGGGGTATVTADATGHAFAMIRAKLSEVDSTRQVEEVSEAGAFRVCVATGTGAAATLPPVLDALRGFGVAVSDITVSKPGLEDVFIHLTGRGLR